MLPDSKELCRRLDLHAPLIGFYDTPDATPFAPCVQPSPDTHACMFAFYKAWLAKRSVHLSKEACGCGGAGHWLFGIRGRSREDFVSFLVDTEGLKASRDLMHRWLDHHHPYQPDHDHLVIGPLRGDQEAYLKSITFYVNPDQLSALMLGAFYDHAPEDPPAVIAPFGSGCMELVPLFADLNAPQAMIGATDIAMRQFLPPETLAFTVTKPMYTRLCALDERSFLHKPFWQTLRKVRGFKEIEG